MGIVAFCPHGHRVKVKDHLAGKKGICPTCGARFRIPHESVDMPPAATATASPAATATATPIAEIVSLDAAVAERLPRALPLARPAAAEPAPSPWTEHARLEPVTVEPAPRLHPLIAERVDLAWCHARPGGTASAPLPAAAMQAWLESGVAAADALVWRADWEAWQPLALVFPEHLGG